MKHAAPEFAKGFEPLFANARAQAATMVVAAGDSVGGPDNRHRGADQWLYVVAGDGEAVVAGNTLALHAGSLVLIERGEPHEVRNTGRAPLKTLNLYVPPAYDADGEPLPAGED